MQKKLIKTDLALNDEIVALQKNVVGFLNKANQSEAKIRKLAQSLASEYKFWSGNMGFAKNQTKVAQSLGAKFEKMAKELGVPVAGTEAAKNLNTTFDSLKQIDDTLTMMKESISSIPR